MKKQMLLVSWENYDEPVDGMGYPFLTRQCRQDSEARRTAAMLVTVFSGV